MGISKLSLVVAVASFLIAGAARSSTPEGAGAPVGLPVPG